MLCCWGRDGRGGGGGFLGSAVLALLQCHACLPATWPAADGRPEEAFPLLEKGLDVAVKNYNTHVSTVALAGWRQCEALNSLRRR